MERQKAVREGSNPVKIFIVDSNIVQRLLTQP